MKRSFFGRNPIGSRPQPSFKSAMRNIDYLHPLVRTKSFSILRASILLCILSIVVIGSILWAWERIHFETFFVKMKYFQLQEVKVHTRWPLNSDLVKSWLPRLEGRNLFFVRAANLVGVLKEQPWVDLITIQKEYPRRLNIYIEPKKPRAIMIQNGKAHFLNEKGGVIDKVSPQLLHTFDLPVISQDGPASPKAWEFARAIEMAHSIHQKLRPHYFVSEMALDPYPYFRIYLSSPQVEIQLSVESWEMQFPKLVILLNNPPGQIAPIQKINLTFPKKAVVSLALSN